MSLRFGMAAMGWNLPFRSEGGKVWNRRNLAVRHGLAKVGNPHLMQSFTGLRHHQMPAPAACLRSHATLHRDRRPRKRHRWHGLRPRQPGPRRSGLGQIAHSCRRHTPGVDITLALVEHAHGRYPIPVQTVACAAGDVAYNLPSRSWIRPAAAYPLLRKPAAMPLIVKWMPVTTSSSASPAR